MGEEAASGLRGGLEREGKQLVAGLGGVVAVQRHAAGRVDRENVAILAGEVEADDGRGVGRGDGLRVENRAREDLQAAHGERFGGGKTLGVRRGEELRGRLAEVGDLRLDGLALLGVGERLQVHHAFVRHVVEDVVGLLGLRTALLVSTHQSLGVE